MNVRPDDVDRVSDHSCHGVIAGAKRVENGDRQHIAPLLIFVVRDPVGGREIGVSVMPGQKTVEMPPEVLNSLDLHHVITLGTASFTGMPHAATGRDSRRPPRVVPSICSNTLGAARKLCNNYGHIAPLRANSKFAFLVAVKLSRHGEWKLRAYFPAFTAFPAGIGRAGGGPGGR